MKTGLSLRAGSRPKPPASQPSSAGYFRLILPVLLMKNLTVIKIPPKKLVKHPFPSFEWKTEHILTGLEL